jgi:hypothetical protein
MRRNFEKSLAPCRQLLRYYDLPGCLPKGVALCARHMRSRSAVRTANRTTDWFAPKQIRNRRKGKLRVASAARPSMAARVTWSSSISWWTSRASRRGFCELGRQRANKMARAGLTSLRGPRCRGSKPGKGSPQDSYRRFGLVRRRVPLRQPSRIIVREQVLRDASCRTNALSAGSTIDMRKYLGP